MFLMPRQLTQACDALNYRGGHLAIVQQPGRTTMDGLTVSARAAQRIGEILKQEPAGTMLRLSVEGGGCSGFQYKFDMDRIQGSDDTLVRRDNAVVLVDQMSLQFLAGSEIDFVDDLIGASFRVNNPNAKASCGCGTSFAL
jgi:iron-sulfur cluster assembly accessory protein